MGDIVVQIGPVGGFLAAKPRLDVLVQVVLEQDGDYASGG